MNSLRAFCSIIAGKIVYIICKISGLGAGGTWPGETALLIDPNILKHLVPQLTKTVIIAGTNGKTTTSKMVETILSQKNYKIIHNSSGANLLNGITSSTLVRSSFGGKINADIGIFECDEASLPLVLKEFIPDMVVLLNLFRDQLDRYGEVDTVARKWLNALKELPDSSTVIINADDPHLSFIGSGIKAKVIYFGIDDSKYYLNRISHAVDSIYCPNCGKRLIFEGVYLSHLGKWECPSCGFGHPVNSLNEKDLVSSPLPGIYNYYNTLAAVAVGELFRFSRHESSKILAQKFQPVFGRQEEIITGNKKVKILLSKNPAGFNASLKTVLDLTPKALLLVLNDRIPDGRDVSWIWDVDFEMIPDNVSVVVSGDRVYDIALRIKYSQNSEDQRSQPKADQPLAEKVIGQKYFSNIKNSLTVEPNLEDAIKKGLNIIDDNETLFILATYSAMLEVRRILVGRKIL